MCIFIMSRISILALCRTCLVAGLLVGLVGCASSTRIEQNMDSPVAVDGRAYLYGIAEIRNESTEAPPHFVNAVRSYLEQDLQQRAMLAAQGSTADREVRVVLTSYRMRSGFSRQIFGVFAGKDGVDSSVTVVDPVSGAVIGSSSVSSYNVMAVGEQEDIARMHAKEIAKFLAGEVKSRN